MSLAPDPDRPGLQSLAGLLVGIDHVGVAVPDLDVALTLYTTTFGFTLLLREDNAEQGVSEAMLSAGPERSAARLQLLAPLNAQSPIARFLDRAGPGLQHLALTVTDVASAAAILRAGQIRVLYDVARPGTAGSSINFVHPGDTGGVLLELVQPAPPSS